MGSILARHSSVKILMVKPNEPYMLPNHTKAGTIRYYIPKFSQSEVSNLILQDIRRTVDTSDLLTANMGTATKTSCIADLHQYLSSGEKHIFFTYSDRQTELYFTWHST